MPDCISCFTLNISSCKVLLKACWSILTRLLRPLRATPQSKAVCSSLCAFLGSNCTTEIHTGNKMKPEAQAWEMALCWTAVASLLVDLSSYNSTHIKLLTAILAVDPGTLSCRISADTGTHLPITTCKNIHLHVI